MVILLLGASGQLGRELSATLATIGDVVAPPRSALDLERPATIRRTLEAVRPDLIVNAAAYTAVDRAEIEPEIAMAVNGEAPGILADWARRHDAAFLHYSTDYVFDGTGDTPWHEHRATGPINLYGKSKRAGEVAVMDSSAVHLIIRSSWIYSARGSNFLRSILGLARERSHLQVVDDQIGAPTPAWWLAKCTALILAGGIGFVGKRGGLLHAAAAGHTSWHGFAEAIVAGARERGIPLAVKSIEPVPSSAYQSPAARPKNSVFNLDRLENTFGVTPPDWKAALSPVLDEVARSES